VGGWRGDKFQRYPDHPSSPDPESEISIFATVYSLRSTTV